MLDAVLAEVTHLEQLCNEMELALREANFDRLNAALADTRRTMHAFENAMEAAKSVRGAQFDAAVVARLRKVYDVREGQQRRLEHHRDALGDRLAGIARWKEYARAIGGSKAGRARKSYFDDRR